LADTITIANVFASTFIFFCRNTLPTLKNKIELASHRTTATLQAYTNRALNVNVHFLLSSGIETSSLRINSLAGGNS